MRPVLLGCFLVFVAAFSAPASVLYSFSQLSSPPGSYPSPGIDFDFTAPSLLTSDTSIAASSINSPGVHFEGLDLSIQSVDIDPGLDGTVPFIAIRMALNGQEVLSEGVCFESNPYCAGSPMDAQPFDHFGTYTRGDIQLTITSSDTPQTATPEPRLEAASGLLVLLTMIGIAPRARRIITNYTKQCSA